VNLQLPPLKDRGEDILFLAQYFLDRYSSEFGRGRLSLTPKTKLALQQHAWPGNVRELEHRIQKGVLMSTGKLLEVEDLELDEFAGPRHVSLKEAREEADRQTIRDALRLTGGNISMAAKTLGISRPSLHALLTRLDIRAQDYKTGKRQEME
jgi:DNA-binding NtrC family response regulator